MYQQQTAIHNDTDAQSGPTIPKQGHSMVFRIVELDRAISPEGLKLAPVALPGHLKPVGIELRVINPGIIEDAPNHQQAISRLTVFRIGAEFVR